MEKAYYLSTGDVYITKEEVKYNGNGWSTPTNGSLINGKTAKSLNVTNFSFQYSHLVATSTGE